MFDYRRLFVDDILNNSFGIAILGDWILNYQCLFCFHPKFPP